jgi:hypothetical protein
MMDYRKKLLVVLLPMAMAVGSSQVSAGICSSGFLADVYCLATGDKGGANAADEAHRRFKNANPTYAQQEEQFTNGVRGQIGLAPHCTDVFDKYGNHLGCM